MKTILFAVLTIAVLFTVLILDHNVHGNATWWSYAAAIPVAVYVLAAVGRAVYNATQDGKTPPPAIVLLPLLLASVTAVACRCAPVLHDPMEQHLFPAPRIMLDTLPQAQPDTCLALR